MVATGGSVESVTLAGREFAVDAEGDVERMLGGKTAESKPNGNGTFRVIVKQTMSSITGLPLVIDDTRSDQEFLQDLADRKKPFDFSITYANGKTYQASMMIEGEIKASSQDPICTVELRGSKLTPQ